MLASMKGARKVIKAIGKSNKHRGVFEIFKGKAGKIWFRLKAPNDEIILHSQGYKQMNGCKHGIASVKANAKDPEHYEHLMSKTDKPYFNLKAKNKEIIGTSQMYKGYSGRNGGIKSVARWAPGASMLDLTVEKAVSVVKGHSGGKAGPQGERGAVGAPGVPGHPGARGAPGPLGKTGPRGPIGSEGKQGNDGETGRAGKAGAAGERGPKGDPGVPGPRGSAGKSGERGLTGSVGPGGPAGARGPAGPAGPHGPKGKSGSHGSQGKAGTRGPAGARGPVGSAGPRGPKGKSGGHGAQGNAGTRGPAGPAGPRGTPGKIITIVKHVYVKAKEQPKEMKAMKVMHAMKGMKVMKPMKSVRKGWFEIFTGKAGKTWFRLKAPNDEIILHSQGYKSMGGCTHGIESVKANAKDGDHYQHLMSKTDKPYFTLKAKNKEIIGTSQMYKGYSGRNAGIRSVGRWAPSARVVDLRKGTSEKD